MKRVIKFFAGALMIATLAVTGCKVEVESLTQKQMVSKLDEDSKNKVFDEVLAGKNADNLLAKLSDEQKAAIFDKMFTDEKKNEIYNEKLTASEKAKIFDEILAGKRTANTFLSLLTDAEKQAVYNEKLTASEKAKIFDEILADKRTADIFLSLLTDAEKQAVYNEKLTSDEKAKIFNEILADKRTNGKVVELLNDAEKSAVFDALLATKTSTDFIVEIITKKGNETVYQGVKKYITENLTQAELKALLDATDTTAPGDVTNLTVSPGVNSVRLNWTDGTDTDNDLYGYLVSWEVVTSARSIAALEKDTMLVPKSSNNDNSNGVTVVNLTGGTRYSFTVTAVDDIGNKSTGVTVEGTAGEEPIPAGFVKVTVTNVGTFYMAETELTYERWYEVYNWATSEERGENKYTFQDLGCEGSAGANGAEPAENSKQPVTMVSWRDAIIWCNAASEMENLTPYYYIEGTTDFTDKTKVVRIAEDYNLFGTNTANTKTAAAGSGTAEKAVRNTASNGYRLPTEAEWEYAAKGGEKFTYSGSNTIDDVAWYSDNCAVNGVKGTHEVGILKPNKYGLKDMSGNVWELCWDIYSSGSSGRVSRGGSWSGLEDRCAVSARSSYNPFCQYSNLGFRVVRSSSK